MTQTRNQFKMLVLIVKTLLAVVTATTFLSPAYGQAKSVEKVRCIAFELYMRSSDEKLKESCDFIRSYIAERHHVRLKVYDLDQEGEAASRLEQIAKAYKLAEAKLPFVYGLNTTSSGVADHETWKRRIADMLRMEVFTRTGCPRCAKAKQYLPSFMRKYPGIQVEIRDVVPDPQANRRYSEIASSQRIGGISFPGFWLCKQLVVGFDNEQTAASRLEGILKFWTFECEIPAKGTSWIDGSKNRGIPHNDEARWSPVFKLVSLATSDQESEPLQNNTKEAPPPLPLDAKQDNALSPSADDAISLPLGPVLPESIEDHGAEAMEQDAVDVPLFGHLSAKRLGMPLFTILIGLVDGFNPCAMWVLLFLLSVIVNLHDRWKILAVAGTFVVISGLAYFAFMAAWLNVLLIVGFLRWVQITLALLAIIVGSIHVKDFFAFKQGISLSIPESSKPSIYSRVRKIVLAENLVAAISGAAVLAVLVNIIELLCTAGLPALYSQILTLQDYPPWKNYAYLGLYIAAYMFDDSLMVAAVVITLGKKKLQEHEGRWLKLISGLVILLLGFVLLFKPEWLE